ncbi:hypothetical protein DVH24_020467 [Malus domestica]|uniref:Uncharacterized protein n=1 Tax=Malus domestica TaxID=3750 RepID=A0A498JBG2_MALDO|nr:hypothetical protein DVH24_020467 [Malus domestica]
MGSKRLFFEICYIHDQIYVVPRPPVLCINIWRRMWETIRKVVSVLFHFFHLHRESAKSQKIKPTKFPS